MKKLFLYLILNTLYLILSVSSASASEISRPILDLGLVGYWNFDTQVGESTVPDLSGNGDNVDLKGFTVSPLTKAWVGGKIKKAIEFDGAATFLETAGDADILDILSSLTVSAWIYPRSLGGGSLGRIVDNQQGVGGYRLNLVGTNQLSYSIGGTTINSANNAITLNTWQHVIAAYNNNDGNVYLYVNGQPVGSGAVAAPVQNSLTFLIGARNNTPAAVFDGMIDDVRIYNRALSSQEVMRLYRQGGGGSQLSVLKTITNNTSTLDSGTNATDGTSFTTGSIRPTKNSLILLALHSRQGNGVNDDTPTVTGNNLTWYSVNAVLMGGSNLSRIQLFCAQGANPGSGAISISFTKTKISIGWSVSEFNNVAPITGACNTTTVVQSGTANSGAASSLTITLNSFKKSTNRPFMFSMANAPGGITPKSGYDELSELAPSATVEIETEWDPNNPDNSPSASWLNNNCAALAIEIDAGRIGTTTINASPIGKVAKGLVGYWTFDGNDLSGTTANDRSGSGNNGTLTNGPNRAIGKLGQALSFDGVDDYVNTGSRIGPSSGYSASAWINLNAVSGTNIIMAAWNSSTFAYSQFYYSGSGFVGRINQTPTVFIGRSVNSGLLANRWQHVVMTWNGGTTNASIKLYLDGNQVDTTDNNAGSFTAPGGNAINFSIGAQSTDSTPSNFFPGKIDEIRTYNRALTPAEVLSLYRMGR